MKVARKMGRNRTQYVGKRCRYIEYPRYVLRHKVRAHMSQFDVQLTIQRTKDKHPQAKSRLITNNGSQFTNKELKKFVQQLDITLVKTSVTYPQSNGKIERFHRTISEKCLQTNAFIDSQDAKYQIAQYIAYYNTKRLNSAIYYLTPKDMLLGRMTERLQDCQWELDLTSLNRLNTQKVAD